MNAPADFGKSKKPACTLPWRQMIIGGDGEVSPCCFWSVYNNKGESVSLGNINNSSIMEVWNGEPYRRLRAKMAAGDLKETGCAKCSALAWGMDLSLAYNRKADEENPPSTPYAKNMEILKREIASGAQQMTAKPTMIAMTPSYKCNIRCIHCYQEADRALEIRRKGVFEEFFSLVPTMDTINMLGGEPLTFPLWRNFLKQFTRTMNPYIRCSTCTNATFVPDEILEGLRKFERVDVNISLDGVSREVFERVRVGASFDKVIENMERLRGVTLGKPESHIGVTMSVMKANFVTVPDFFQFAIDRDLEFGLSSVSHVPIDQAINCFSDPAIDMRGWREAVDRARDILKAREHRYAQEELTKEAAHQWYTFHNNILKTVEELVPWGILNWEHLPITLEKSDVERIGVRTGEGMVLAFFPWTGSHFGERRYFAVERNGAFAVSLPEGEYGLSSTRQYDAPLLPSKRNRLIVAKTGVSFSSEKVYARIPFKRPLRLLSFMIRPAFRRLDGSCWLAPLPQYQGCADTAASHGRSPLVLLENGDPLGPAHAVHRDIERFGSGRYSHWGDALFFSTSDNSDPNANGREYELAVMEEFVPPPMRRQWVADLLHFASRCKKIFVRNGHKPGDLILFASRCKKFILREAHDANSGK